MRHYNISGLTLGQQAPGASNRPGILLGTHS